jgi:hypothetical protein
MPLDVTLVGSYSPQDVFFRTFKLASDRFSLGGFLMLGSNFVELQAFELSLDGGRQMGGTLFLPFSFERWRTSRSLLVALDEEQNVDLAIDHLDLGQLAGALGEKSIAAGILDGKLAAFGLLRALQVTTTFRLEGLGREPANSSIDFHGRLADSRIEADATAFFGISNPVALRASLPVRLEKKQLQAGTAFDRAKPFSLALDCPALFLETLPNEWRAGAERGLVTGTIAWAGTLQAPTISGEASLLDARFLPPPPWPEVNNLRAKVRFLNTEALIDSLQFEVDSTPIQLRGRLTTSAPVFGLTLTPENGAIELASLLDNTADLSSIRVLGEGRNDRQPHLQLAIVRGRVWPSFVSSLTVTTEEPGHLSSFQTTYFFRPRALDASPLLLRSVPAAHEAGFELEVTERELPPRAEPSP